MRFSGLGPWRRSGQSMGPQVTGVCRSCFYQLRQLRVVRQSLTEDALRSLVKAFIHCRLDYCNVLLAGIAGTQVKRLQSVQNAAARLVSGARRRNHITSVCAASTGFRCGGGSFSRPRSLYGNVSMMSLPPVYRKYAYQWRV